MFSTLGSFTNLMLKGVVVPPNSPTGLTPISNTITSITYTFNQPPDIRPNNDIDTYTFTATPTYGYGVSPVTGSFSPNLEFYYRFDTADVNGTNIANYADPVTSYDASFANSAAITTSVVNVGTGSLSLNSATSSYVILPTIPQGILSKTTTAKGISIVCWYYMTTTSTNAKLFDFADGATPSNNISFSPDGGAFVINGTDGLQTYSIVPPSSDPCNATGQWIHLCWTLSYADNVASLSTWNIYINGALTYTDTSGIYPVDIDRTSNYLGQSNNVGDPYFNGYIDEFRFYKKVLTQSEINDLYSNLNNTGPNLYTISGLTYGTTYQVKMSALNTYGTSAPSTMSWGTLLPAITGITGITNGANSMAFSFDVPTYLPDYYDVSVNQQNNAPLYSERFVPYTMQFPSIGTLVNTGITKTSSYQMAYITDGSNRFLFYGTGLSGGLKYLKNYANETTVTITYNQAPFAVFDMTALATSIDGTKLLFGIGTNGATNMFLYWGDLSGVVKGTTNSITAYRLDSARNYNYASMTMNGNVAVASSSNGNVYLTKYIDTSYNSTLTPLSTTFTSLAGATLSPDGSRIVICTIASFYWGTWNGTTYTNITKIDGTPGGNAKHSLFLSSNNIILTASPGAMFCSLWKDNTYSALTDIPFNSYTATGFVIDSSNDLYYTTSTVSTSLFKMPYSIVDGSFSFPKYTPTIFGNSNVYSLALTAYDSTSTRVALIGTQGGLIYSKYVNGNWSSTSNMTLTLADGGGTLTPNAIPGCATISSGSRTIFSYGPYGGTNTIYLTDASGLLNTSSNVLSVTTASLSIPGSTQYYNMSMSIDGSKMAVATNTRVYYALWNPSANKFGALTILNDSNTSSRLPVALSTDGNKLLYNNGAAVRVAFWDSSNNIYSSSINVGTTTGTPRGLSFVGHNSDVVIALTNTNTSQCSFWNGNSYGAFVNIISSALLVTLTGNGLTTDPSLNIYTYPYGQGNMIATSLAFLNTTRSTYQVTNPLLTSGLYYNLSMTESNLYGTSPVSNVVQYGTKLGTLTLTGNATATSTTGIGIDVNPSQTITYYSYNIYQGPTLITSGTTQSSPLTISGLTSGTMYNGNVSATNLYSTTTYFPISYSTICDAPTNVMTSNLKPTSVSITYNTVSGASSYTATASPSISGNTSTNTSVTNLIQLTNLSPDTDYSASVRAINGNGLLSSLSSISFKTPPPLPTMQGTGTYYIDSTSVSGYYNYVFTGNGTLKFDYMSKNTLVINLFAVGGGGGGGARFGGGGGAGGVVQKILTLPSGSNETVSITIGTGGLGWIIDNSNKGIQTGTNGGNTKVEFTSRITLNKTAYGGGYGGTDYTNNGRGNNGASGGGSDYSSTPGYTLNYADNSGNNGSAGSQGVTNATWYSGGGGGAGQASINMAKGGDGVVPILPGMNNTWWFGGGGGAYDGSNTKGYGGKGGGGAGYNYRTASIGYNPGGISANYNIAGSGGANTGGGGGGSINSVGGGGKYGYGGNGGSGIVMISVSTANVMSAT